MGFFPADECEELGKDVLSFAVFPVYEDWYDPPMHLVAEVVPFMHQLLEGLAFFSQ
ncbi:hypothetical protein PENSPDRAFT_657406 [Peniophora sp. CONT]|nr:hypothetical protein PENSPDRAFT_657406 [Peniophora sp. CONT]